MVVAHFGVDVAVVAHFVVDVATADFDLFGTGRIQKRSLNWKHENPTHSVGKPDENYRFFSQHIDNIVIIYVCFIVIYLIVSRF